MQIPFRSFLRDYLVSWALGSLSPARVGDLSIIYFLKAYKVPVGQASAITLIDKGITFVVLSLIAAFGSLLFFQSDNGGILILFILSAGFILSALFYSKRFREWANKHILKKYANNFKGFSKTIFYFLKKKKGLLFLNSIVTLIKSLMNFFGIMVLFLAFDTSVPFLHIATINAILTFLSLIPFSLSGLGIREASAVVLFSNIGINPIIAANVYFLSLIKKYVMALVITFIPDKKL